MPTVILFALAYLFLVAGLLFANYRWHNHLNQTAIPGLDTVNTDTADSRVRGQTSPTVISGAQRNVGENA